MSHIRCLFSHLVARCKERGYDIHSAMPCITLIDGDYVVVDTEHWAYPVANKKPAEIVAHAEKVKEHWARQNQKSFNLNATPHRSPPGCGPGTELKKMLAKIGITATSTCSCNKRAQVMDDNGIEWCKANTTTIVGWLREEATKRGLPFIDLAGKILVKRAISLAETAEKKRKQTEEANNAANG
jgi:hypothetical protein